MAVATWTGQVINPIATVERKRRSANFGGTNSSVLQQRLLHSGFQGVVAIPRTSGRGPERIKKANIGMVRQHQGVESLLAKAVNTVVPRAMRKLQEAGTTSVDVHIENLDPSSKLHPDVPPALTERYQFLPGDKTAPPAGPKGHRAKEPPKPYLDLICRIAHGLADPKDDPTYADRLLQQDEFKRKIDRLIASIGLGALALPDVPIPPPWFEDVINGRFEIAGFPVNAFQASQTRLPAITVPADFTDDRLLVGLQLSVWGTRDSTCSN
ncbi:hypothetical protein DL770_010124 [Monosporascus sp. CRB-9-2]|nr:hypothetical protein DL770_010124 [Monosporascus sp. CRB-9-2]